MSASLTATWVEQNQCPLHQSILLTQGPIHEIFIKKYWELTKPWKWLLFSFLVFGFWLLGCSKKFFFGFSVWKKPRSFIWGSIYSCTMDGFFTIFKKAVSELICTRLYINVRLSVLDFFLFYHDWLWNRLSKSAYLNFTFRVNFESQESSKTFFFYLTI